MKLEQKEEEGLIQVSLEGEVDMRSSPELRDELLAVAKKKIPRVAINLEQVSYIDSSGIATLIQCLKHVAEYGGKLTLIGVNDDIYPVFELAHLLDVFDLRREATID